MIVVLWSLCLLSVFSVSLGYNVRQKIGLVKRLEERDRARFMVDSGMKIAAFNARNTKEDTYFCMGSLLSNNAEAFSGIMVNGGSLDIRYDYINEDTGLVETRYGLIDEESKINLNFADLNTIARFFQFLTGLDEKGAEYIAAAIIDWRDKDSVTTQVEAGTENYHYTMMGYPYEAKNSAFEVLEEVLLVEGIDQDIFEKIKNYITIYSKGGRVNINTATKTVLLALGLSLDMANKVMQFRRGPDGTIGTEDDGVFREISEIVPVLSTTYELSPSEVANISNVAAQYLTVNASAFSASIIAKINGRKGVVAADCVVDKDGRILHWREP